MEKLARTTLQIIKPHPQLSLLQHAARNFASKYSKGSFGREDSASETFRFPKHKELFTDDYYNYEKHDGYDP